MSRRVRLLRVSKDTMLEMMEGRTFLLGLPWDSEITDIEWDIRSRSFIMLIHNDGFPEVEEGKVIPELGNEMYTTGRKGPAKIVADQSRFDGLWAETDDTQAQLLQQALRELHDAFERPDVVPIPSTIERRGSGDVSGIATVVQHILHHGHTLCGRFPGLKPKDWPPSHIWVGLREFSIATCSECLDRVDICPLCPHIAPETTCFNCKGVGATVKS